MRKDALGLFWRDEPVVKKLKPPKPKATPPDPHWLRSDYLPYLEEAREMRGIEFISDEELYEMSREKYITPKEEFIFDFEVYRNYFGAGFKSVTTGKIVVMEMFAGREKEFEMDKFRWMLRMFTVIGFNSFKYDLSIASLVEKGCTTQQLKQASDMMIKEEMYHKDVLKYFRTKKVSLKEVDHIDLLEVAPLRGSLKSYAGRCHAKRMQDLPFDPDIELSDDQITITRYYMCNDLANTLLLRETLREHISVRIEMTEQYGIDMRSKSDAQIAEAVFAKEVEQQIKARVETPEIAPGTVYRYHPQPYMRFTHPELAKAFATVCAAPFIVADHGSIETPPTIDDLDIHVAGRKYTIGIGGLHSNEKKQALVECEEYTLHDFDVTSFYPRIILNQGLYPKHLGPAFLRIYDRIVCDRVEAKRSGNKLLAQILKILVNGSYGKLGSKYSKLYSPDLLIQVTMTGQLSLLMLIEWMEWAGITVASANTDGIVLKCPKGMKDAMYDITKAWQAQTGFELEETQYLKLLSRDVNNYIAVKKKFDKVNKVWLNEPAGCKTKGAFANPWGQSEDKSEWMHKNPTGIVCVEAIEQLLTTGTPIDITIKNCRQAEKFMHIRAVKGGAVKIWHRDGDPMADGQFPTENEYLGKTVRFYYATGVPHEMVYAKNGKKVPKSDGARPCMDLPTSFPIDIDYERYIADTEKMLKSLAYA